MNFTDAGVVSRTPEEIRASLIAEAENKLTGFNAIPAELRTDLIESSVIIMSQMEELGVDLFNSIAPQYANDIMVKEFGESFGLQMKKESYSSVVITFYGRAGTVVPKGTQVQSADGVMTFGTTRSIAILPSGEYSVLCESLESYTVPIMPNTITVLVSTITNITRITNLNIGTNGLPAETIEQYRARVQDRMRSNRMGSVVYAISKLAVINGVENRLTNIRYQVKNINDVITSSVECVVGGGDDYEVAFTLFECFLSPLLFSSSPSDGNIDRTITSVLSLNGINFDVKFTRPKLDVVDINVVMRVITGSVPIPDTAIRAELYNNLFAYFKDLRTGTALSKFVFDDIVFNTILSMGVEIKNIDDLILTIAINNIPQQFNENNKIYTEFDVAYTFNNITFTKVG